MASPFKLKGTPAKNVNGLPEKKVAVIPREYDASVNSEQLDVVPGKNPEIKWPPAENGPKPSR